MNCHTNVAQDHPEVKKIVASIESGTPIQWTRVHWIPDHVYFSHSPHVNADIQCQTCHGQVEEMGRVTQWAPLTMGWCVNCHRDTEVQFIDNAFYEKYEEMHKELKAGERQQITVEDIGGIECMKCHY